MLKVKHLLFEVSMNKKRKELAIVIAFLTLVLVAGIVIKDGVDTKPLVGAESSANAKASDDAQTQVDMKEPGSEAQISSFFIEFEEGITEQEVKSILENSNLTTNCTIDFNSNIMPERYYLIVDADKRMSVKDELRAEENWTTPLFDFPERWKGDNYIITVPEQIINDESFQAILEKNDLQVKKTVRCYIRFWDKNGNSMGDDLQIQNELEANDSILFLLLEGKVGSFLIQFENGTTESEVKSVLKNYNMTMNYTIDYNYDSVDPGYYIPVDKDKIANIRNELGKVENWKESEFIIKKDDHYIFMVYEQFTQDESLHSMIEKNNLKLEKSVWCVTPFENNPSNWIWGRDAIRIKRDLETNEKVMTVIPEYYM